MTRTIDNIKYSRRLLSEAENFESSGGRISLPEARQLWDSVMLRGGLDKALDKRTLKYIIENLNCGEPAKRFLNAKMEGRPVSFYRRIKGVYYDRALLERGESAAAAEGGMSLDAAKAFYADAKDGGTITPTEHATMEYVLKNCKLTTEASAFLKEQMYPKAKAASYYKQIDNVKYDRQLLEEAAAFAAEGPVSIAQAKLLYESAADGHGVTSCENATLEYALKTYEFTDDAKIYLLSELQSQHVVKTLEEVSDGIPDSPKGPTLGAFVPDNIKKGVEERLDHKRRDGMDEMQALSEEAEERWGNIFDEMDEDGDGCLTHEEVTKFVNTRDAALEITLGLGKWSQFLETVDADGDGKISREEFVIYAVNCSIDVETAAGFLFDAMDADDDNDLTLDEVKDYEWYRNPHLFQVLGIDNFESMIAGMDSDGNGQIDRDEFVAFFKKRADEGALSWKKSVETAKDWEKEGLGNYRQDRKRKIAENECWDYAKGFCHRGAKCKWAHNPMLTQDASVLSARKQSSLALAKTCDLNLSNATLVELETLSEQEAEDLIRAAAEDDVKDPNFYIVKKAHLMRVPEYKQRQYKRRRTRW